MEYNLISDPPANTINLSAAKRKKKKKKKKKDLLPFWRILTKKQTKNHKVLNLGILAQRGRAEITKQPNLIKGAFFVWAPYWETNLVSEATIDEVSPWQEVAGGKGHEDQEKHVI